MTRWTIGTRIALAVLVPAVAFVLGCAQEGTSDETGAEASSSGAGGSNDGGGGPGSSGGSGGTGGGVVEGCADDCSALPTPACMVSACDEMTGMCVLVPVQDGASCDDGVFCTEGETCKGGVCGGGSMTTCGLADDACNAVTCDEAGKTCALSPVADGSACLLDEPCVVNTACKAGVCKGTPRDCFFAPVPDMCHVSVCNPQTDACEPVPGNDGLTCPDDGDLCMLNKVCQAGLCQGGVPKDCSAFTDGCNAGVCDGATGTCGPEPLAAATECPEAVDECNTGACDGAGQCQPVPTPGVACSGAVDACNVGQCSEAGACEPVASNDGNACDDGDSCTSGETCAAGVCAGGVVGAYVVYFSESFADNAAGWTLGQGWSIGSTGVSSCGDVGNEDPALDHSPTDDNGVAGVALGGCPAKGVHAAYYLESPAINADVVGPVVLDFWRWLNSDFKPYMMNTIEVWNGSAWMLVWESGGFPSVQDSSWTRVTYDITAHKNAAMKVRFGWSSKDAGGFVMPGWNIDDFVIANSECN